MEIRQATSGDYQKIIDIQNANKPEQLTEDMKKQGFLASSMDEQQLEAMNKALGILVAVEDGQLAGFVCMAPTSPLPAHPVVRAMHETFPHQQFDNQSLMHQRAFIYGPVCIDRQWRGKGVVQQLFSGVKDFTREHYDLGAAFIDDRNPHSLAVHVEGLKMTALTPFECAGQRYQLVVFSTCDE